jgi:2-keto-4-pentenoate hydratase/2-oxohepta-3-ene-1,7-dioic acid hydratase in catechol pathway
MKLASFRAEGRDCIGIAEGESHLRDISEALTAASPPNAAPRNLVEVIEMGNDGVALLRRIAAEGSGRLYSIADIEWQPPVRRPSKLCCLALNNSANAERIMSGPKHPAMFIKPASSLVGHNGAIVCRPEYGRVHPEPELAVVIGRQAKDISADQAVDHIFGYTILNDITSPTMRVEDTFHYRAIHPKGGSSLEIEYVDTWTSYPGRYKGCDTFSCLGPWIVTRDEIPEPHKLKVQCHHQGRLVTEDTTENLFFKTPEVLSFLSRYVTLWPGDIVAMGTALKKSAAGGAVQNVDLNKLGGPVSVTMEKIGTLSNTVINRA